MSKRRKQFVDRHKVGIKKDKVIKPFCTHKGCNQHVHLQGEECEFHYYLEFESMRLTRWI